MDKKRVMDYVIQDGGICPNCGSDNIMGGRFTADGDRAYQEIECGSCYFKWDDVYRLVGIAINEAEILIDEQ